MIFIQSIIKIEREMKSCICEITAAMRKYGFAKMLNRTLQRRFAFK